MLRETKEQTLSVRVTRLADWLLRIRARYEPMNGFTESAGLLHELLAKTESLEAEVAILRKAQATCNGFCGEYECKENQSNCKRKASEK